MTVPFFLKYGKGRVPVDLSGKNIKAVLEPVSVSGFMDGQTLIGQALGFPVGKPPVNELVRAGQKVAVIVSDSTRPCPTSLLMPSLSGALLQAGIKYADIKIIFATGTHRATTGSEKESLLGKEIASHFLSLDHQCTESSNLTNLGTSSYGNPVYINQAVMEADFKIGVANIEPHVFAGYSGGSKSVMPGTAGLETIMKNHEMIYSFPEETRAGLLENPIRKEIDEIGCMTGLDYLLNVVLNDEGKIVHAVAGDAVLAFLEGVKVCDGIYKRPLQERGDIVVASAGGYPKDINFYQAQKALDYASMAVRDGGAIILVAECSEGIGSEPLARFMAGATSWEKVVAEGRSEKSYHPYGLRGLANRDIEVFLISSLPESALTNTPLRWGQGIDEALSIALGNRAPGAGVVLMPYAGSTLPCITT